MRQLRGGPEQAFYVAIEEQVPHLPKVFDRHFQDGERDYYVIAEPRESEPQPAPEATPGRVRLQWAALTDQGVERDHNEDAIDARVYSRANGDLLGLFVVADGLGGQDSGEVASGMTIEVVWEACARRVGAVAARRGPEPRRPAGSDRGGGPGGQPRRL